MIFPMLLSWILFLALCPLTKRIKAIVVFNVYKIQGLIEHLDVLFVSYTRIEFSSNIPSLLTCITNIYPQVSFNFLISQHTEPQLPPSPSLVKSFCYIVHKTVFLW